jgi:V8-like Glu-specific endopeptidase
MLRKTERYALDEEDWLVYLHLGRAEPAPHAIGETPRPITPVALTRVLDTVPEPFRWICHIHVRTVSGGNSVGTGVLIGRYHVLTCAHVLYPRAHAREHPETLEVTVLPGQRCPDDSRPRLRANGWAVSPGWRWNHCRAAGEDLGIIRLARPTDVGFWPIAPFEPSTLTGVAVHLAGYPSRPEDVQAHCMYRSRGRVIGRFQLTSCTEPTPQRKGDFTGTPFGAINDTTKLIFSDLDTLPSMSGGPMWTIRDGRRVLFALHLRDIDHGQQKRRIGLLLNSAVRQRIAGWMTRVLPPLRTRSG